MEGQMPLVSIVIRTLNESLHLNNLLLMIARQDIAGFDLETVVVDSGSTDETIRIAEDNGCRITNIDKRDFTFGRSLNVGCEFARGDYLVFISGHCVPVDQNWLQNLLEPLVSGQASYSYGRQIGGESTKPSEEYLFQRLFPVVDMIPQEGIFCNNANAAIDRKVWLTFRFNEVLTGLEDMYLAKQLTVAGLNIAYCSTANVYHFHEESWRQVKLRYEREAIAMQEILPNEHATLRGFFYCIIQDVLTARKQGKLIFNVGNILAFNICQYWGQFRGYHKHRKLEKRQQREYYYPVEHAVKTDSSDTSKDNASIQLKD